MDIIILGSGAFAKEAYDWIIQSGHNVIGFFSSIPSEIKTLRGLPVYFDAKHIPKNAQWIIGTGNVVAMENLVKAVSDYIAPSKAIIHPSCILGNNVNIGNGSIICPMSIITTDININSCVVINIACTIGHDCVIGDFVHIAPNTSLSGYTKIGSFCEIGTSVSTIPNIEIVDRCIIGAGSVITVNLPEAGLYVGVPAILKKKFLND
ncbi:MAG TPA: acetyltransferase [Burkholderiales bacterium]|nr:acetyltransferase [Burkholderiales bacterium]